MRSIAMPTVATAAIASLLLAACAPQTSHDVPGLQVAAAFYPLQFVAERVAGDHADITTLAAPGVEPHDIELSPATVRSLKDTDLVLYIGEFQPAVDDALASTGAHGLDVADVVELHPAEHDHSHEGEEHGADDAEDEDGHDHGSSDPHFWLDPSLLAQYTTAVATEFARLDPENAADYAANGAALVADLETLDGAFVDGLAVCERHEIVVSHEAFGYLAEAHGLEQVGVAGIDPETEPSPARLRDIAEIIEHTGATTIFTESAVSASVVEALASDAGVDTEVLDPVETIAVGDDYIAVMTRNLETLRSALACD